MTHKPYYFPNLNNYVHYNPCRGCLQNFLCREMKQAPWFSCFLPLWFLSTSDPSLSILLIWNSEQCRSWGHERPATPWPHLQELSSHFQTRWQTTDGEMPFIWVPARISRGQGMLKIVVSLPVSKRKPPLLPFLGDTFSFPVHLCAPDHFVSSLSLSKIDSKIFISVLSWGKSWLSVSGNRYWRNWEEDLLPTGSLLNCLNS